MYAMPFNILVSEGIEMKHRECEMWLRFFVLIFHSHAPLASCFIQNVALGVSLLARDST